MYTKRFSSHPKRTTSTCHFNQLSDNVVAHILSFLPLKDRITCTLVSHRLCNVSRTFAARNTFALCACTSGENTKKWGKKTLANISVWARAVRKVDIACDLSCFGETAKEREHNLQEILSILKHVVHIGIHDPRKTAKGLTPGHFYGKLSDGGDCIEDEKVNLNVLTSCRQLSSLEIYCGGRVCGWEALEKLPNLKKLGVRHVGIEKGRAEAAIAVKACKNIEKLTLVGHMFDNSYSSLENLTALSCKSYSLPADLSPWNRLTHIEITGMMCGSLRALSTSFNLESVIVSPIDERGVGQLCQCTRLREVWLSGSVKRDAVKVLGVCKDLRKIVLNGQKVEL